MNKTKIKHLFFVGLLTFKNYIMEAEIKVFNYTGAFKWYLVDLGYSKTEIEKYMTEFTDNMKVKIMGTYCLYDPNGLLD